MLIRHVMKMLIRLPPIGAFILGSPLGNFHG